MKKTLFWPYKYPDMKETWRQQTIWIAKALEENGYQILKHPNFICDGLNCDIYDWKKDKFLDIVIYNHADISHLTGDIAQSNCNLFLKPTVPTKYHATLDILGYGPFSSIAYYKPNFEFALFIYNLLWWIILISFSVALINMLPIGIFDGGRFFFLAIAAITGNEKFAKKAFVYLTYLFLLLLAVIMFFWFRSFLQEDLNLF